MSPNHKCDVVVKEVTRLMKNTDMTSVGLAFRILSVISFILGMLSFLVLLPGDIMFQRVLKRRWGTFLLLVLQWAVLIPFLVLYVRLDRIGRVLITQLELDCALPNIPNIPNIPAVNKPLSLFLACFGTCLAVVLTLRFLRMSMCNNKLPAFEHPGIRTRKNNYNYNHNFPSPSAFILHPRRPQKVAMGNGVHWSDSGELRDMFWSSDEASDSELDQVGHV